MDLLNKIMNFVNKDFTRKNSISIENALNNVDILKVEEKHQNFSENMVAIYNKSYISKDEVIGKIKLENAPYYDFIYCSEKSLDNVLGDVLKEDKA